MRTKTVKASDVDTKTQLVEEKGGRRVALSICEVQRSGRVVTVTLAESWERRTFDVRDRVRVKS